MGTDWFTSSLVFHFLFQLLRWLLALFSFCFYFHLSKRITKLTIRLVRPAKTQISMYTSYKSLHWSHVASSLCFSVHLALRFSCLGKRELILVLFVRLFDLGLFWFVGFLFLLVSGKGWGLWLWHSLDFSLTFSFHSRWTIQEEINENLCHTDWPYKLLWVFAGHNGLNAGFVVGWLICFANLSYCLKLF